MRALALIVLALAPSAAAAEPARVNLPQGDSRVCRTVWRSLELMVEYSGECSLPGRARRVTVRGPAWRTRDGLRIGDPARRIAQIYRGARLASRSSEYPPLGSEWDLRRARPSSSVIVASRNGRVIGFELRRG